MKRGEEKKPYPWVRVVVCSVLLSAAILAGLELTLRADDRLPQFRETVQTWASRRRQIPTNTNALVVVGASKIQAAFSPGEFEALEPNKKVVMLAVYGKANSMPVLADVLKEDNFAGTVLVSLQEWTTENFQDQQPWLDAYYGAAGWAVDFDSWLRTKLHSKLVALNDFYDPKQVAFHVLKGIGSSRSYLTQLEDGSIRLDFQSEVGQRMRDFERGNGTGFYEDVKFEWGVDAEHWIAGILKIEPLVREFQKRGGKVVYLRLPAAYGVNVIESDWKTSHWDPLCAQSEATCIHFSEEPALAEIIPPDGIHLDYRDRQAATRAIHEILARRELL